MIDTAKIQEILKHIIDAFRNPRMLMIAGASALALVIWYLAWYSPESTKLATLSTQVTTLQAKVTAAQQEVATLKIKSKNDCTLERRLSTLDSKVASTTGPATNKYLDSLKTLATASGVVLTSASPATPTSPPAGSGGSTSSATQPFTTITVTLVMKGAYDTLLRYLKSLYALPRLTLINEVEISGGATTGRATPLTMTLTIMTFATVGLAPSKTKKSAVTTCPT